MAEGGCRGNGLGHVEDVSNELARHDEHVSIPLDSEVALRGCRRSILTRSRSGRRMMTAPRRSARLLATTGLPSRTGPALAQKPLKLVGDNDP